MRYFSRRFFISFSVCLSIDPIKFDFKKGQGSMSFQEAKRRLIIHDVHPPLSAAGEGGGGVVPPTKFSKRGRGLTGPQL